MAKPWNIIDLDPSASLRAGLRKIAETRLQETLSYEHATLVGEDIEALHDMRVSARRLRAVLRLFRDCFPRKKFKRHDEKLQMLIRALGPVRERDVLIGSLRDYRSRLRAEDGKVIDLLLAREETVRAKERKSMVQALRKLKRSKFEASFKEFVRTSL